MVTIISHLFPYSQVCQSFGVDGGGGLRRAYLNNSDFSLDSSSASVKTKLHLRQEDVSPDECRSILDFAWFQGQVRFTMIEVCKLHIESDVFFGLQLLAAEMLTWPSSDSSGTDFFDYFSSPPPTCWALDSYVLSNLGYRARESTTPAQYYQVRRILYVRAPSTSKLQMLSVLLLDFCRFLFDLEAFTE